MTTAPSRTATDLWRIVVARAWVVAAAIVAAVVGAGAMVTLQDDVYRASATVLIDVGDAVGLGDRPTSPAAATRQIETEIQLVESEAVALRVQADLGLATRPPAVSAGPVRDTNAITVVATAGSATAAANLANGYAFAYIAESRQRDEVEIDARLVAVQEELDAVDAQLAQIGDALENAEEPDRTRLEDRRVQLQETAVALGAEIAELRVDRRTLTGHGEVSRPATAPSAPVEPKPITSMILAAILGAFVGLAGALLLERVANPLGDRRAVEQLTGGRPVLAQLPRQAADAAFPAVAVPSSLMTNQLRVLHRLIAASAREGRMGVVQVTSAGPGDGKSTVAANLAAVMANAGLRVALIDADLHRPRQAELFGKTLSPGLGDALTRAKPVDFQPINDRLFLLAAGKAQDPSGLLGDAALVRLLQALRNEFDAVVIDSPPVQPLADAVVVASLADTTLVVADPARTTSSQLLGALDILDRARVRVVGIVLNRVDERRRGTEAYGDTSS